MGNVAARHPYLFASLRDIETRSRMTALREISLLEFSCCEEFGLRVGRGLRFGLGIGVFIPLGGVVLGPIITPARAQSLILPIMQSSLPRIVGFSVWHFQLS